MARSARSVLHAGSAAAHGSHHFNPSLHPHAPGGSPIGGQFVSTAGAAAKAFKAAAPGGYAHLSRSTLLKKARDRGITLQRGAPDADIIKALTAHDKLHGTPGPAAKKIANAAAGSSLPKAPSPSGSAAKKIANATAPPKPSAPIGRKVPVSAAGIAGVTSAPIAVPSRHAPTFYAHGAKQSQEIHLNGVSIGTVHQMTGSIGWYADDPAGNSVHTFIGSSRGDAIKALVAQHQHTQLTTTTVKGATLTHWNSPMASAAGAASLNVAYNGLDVGDIHDSGRGVWTAFPPNSAGYTLGQGGAGGNYATKDLAVQALVDAHLKHNAPAPPAAAPDPTLDTARDAIYGRHPKANTAAFQLGAYGLMRRSHFDDLNTAEQSTVLGDLSFIATTYKGANAAKAQKLIDRFTPPGTPSGTIPNQPINVPAGAVSNQTRVADPAGTAGLLKVLAANKRGQSGDGWTRTAGGGTGPWGQYGASGLMLRHVDDQGVARYLMIERGPGISDPGKWQFPGGAKDQHETFYEGAAREVVEELGFKTTDLDQARVHGTHAHTVSSVMVTSPTGGKEPWAYTSVAATVPTQLKPDLSTSHAQAETSDAKWMTAAEIDKLDKSGKLLAPLAGGQLQKNVMSLFPPAAKVGRPGPTTVRPPRLAPAAPHKPSRGRDLLPDTTARNQLRQDVKNARSRYTGKVADDRLAAIGAMQGFDDTPTVVPKSEFERLLKTGDYIEAWRGVRGSGGGYSGPTRGGQVSRNKTAAQINEEFRSGPAYYGLGMYGNGYYFGTSKSVAQGYSDGTKGSLLRVLIPKKARIEPHKKIASQAHAASKQYSQAKGHSNEPATLYDEGRYAAAKGIDALEIDHLTAYHVASPGKPAFNVLNRSVLIVEEG